MFCVELHIIAIFFAITKKAYTRGKKIPGTLGECRGFFGKYKKGDRVIPTRLLKVALRRCHSIRG